MFAMFVTYTTEIRYPQWRWYNGVVSCFHLLSKHAAEDGMPCIYGCLPTDNYRCNKNELENNHAYFQYLVSRSLKFTESEFADLSSDRDILIVLAQHKNRYRHILLL